MTHHDPRPAPFTMKSHLPPTGQKPWTTMRDQPPQPEPAHGDSTMSVRQAQEQRKVGTAKGFLLFLYGLLLGDLLVHEAKIPRYFWDWKYRGIIRGGLFLWEMGRDGILWTATFRLLRFQIFCGFLISWCYRDCDTHRICKCFYINNLYVKR